MLYITTNKEDSGINDADLYFDIVIARQTELYENDECIKVMKEIGQAEYIGNEIIKTPFGVTHVSKLSTSCKIVLLLLIFSKKGEEAPFVSIIECGSNAIQYIFDKARELDFKVFFNKVVILEIGNYSCMIDGEEVNWYTDIEYRLEDSL